MIDRVEYVFAISIFWRFNLNEAKHDSCISIFWQASRRETKKEMQNLTANIN